MESGFLGRISRTLAVVTEAQQTYKGPGSVLEIPWRQPCAGSSLAPGI